MKTKFGHYMIHDALRQRNSSRQPDSREMGRLLDTALTSCRGKLNSRIQSQLEIEIRDEISRRRGNRTHWPF